jgi:hypothetical protein
MKTDRLWWLWLSDPNVAKDVRKHCGSRNLTSLSDVPGYNELRFFETTEESPTETPKKHFIAVDRLT